MPQTEVSSVRVPHPFAGRQQVLLPLLPLDLHVLSLPLAFILSQDQTLHCKWIVRNLTDVLKLFKNWKSIGSYLIIYAIVLPYGNYFPCRNELHRYMLLLIFFPIFQRTDLSRPLQRRGDVMRNCAIPADLNHPAAFNCASSFSLSKELFSFALQPFFVVSGVRRYTLHFTPQNCF